MVFFSRLRTPFLLFALVHAPLLFTHAQEHGLTSPEGGGNAAVVDLDSRAVMATVYKKCTVPNTAARTFDDGPYDFIYSISDKLKAANASATFFFNGNNFGCIYSAENVKRVKHVYGRGHQIASHGWSHADMTKLSASQVDTEIQKVDQALTRIFGVVPAFIRPPFGYYNNRVREVAATRKKALVIWDFDSGDSTGASTSQQKENYRMIAKKHPSTILTVNHETHANFVNQVLPDAIKSLQKAGYRLVTVAECLGKKPYLSTGKASTKDSSWRC